MPLLQNLVRGRGLLVRTLMKSQLASPEFTAVFAALVAVINCKLPEVGELLLKRIVWQVRAGVQSRTPCPSAAGCTELLHARGLCTLVACRGDQLWPCL